MSGSCANIKVKANAQGHTDVVISYMYQSVELKAIVKIAAYRPLKVCRIVFSGNYVTCSFVLAVGKVM